MDPCVKASRGSTFERRSTLWLAVTVATLASMLVGILPLGIGMFADHFSLSLGETGVLASAVQAGAGIGGLAVLLLRRFPHWRALMFGCALLGMLLNALTVFAHSAAVLMSLQLLASIAAGCVYGLSIYIVGSTPSPDRAFGVMYSVGLAGYSLFALLFPLLLRGGGFVPALNSFGAFLLLAGFIAWFLPDHDVPDRDRQKPAVAGIAEVLESGLGLVGLILFELGIFAVWAYTERIGKIVGIAPEGIGGAVAVGGLAGVAGALTAAALNVRLGRVTTATIAVAAVLLGNALLWRPSSFVAFVVGCCLFSYGWLLALPYFMGAIVALDRTGALRSLILPAQTAGAILGPATAALTVDTSSTRGAVAVSSVACLMAIVPLASVTMRSRRLSHATQGE